MMLIHSYSSTEHLRIWFTISGVLKMSHHFTFKTATLNLSSIKILMLINGILSRRFSRWSFIETKAILFSMKLACYKVARLLHGQFSRYHCVHKQQVFGGLRNSSIFTGIWVQDIHFDGFQCHIGTGFKHLEQAGWLQRLTARSRFPAVMLLPNKLRWPSSTILFSYGSIVIKKRAQDLLRSIGVFTPCARWRSKAQ